MSGMTISGQKEVSRNMGSYGDRFMSNLFLFSGAFAGQLEAKAVRTRPWTDRTNVARNSISGSHARDSQGIVVALAIGVSYGKYLELANGGRYRVIRPTVDSMRQEFLKLPLRAQRSTIV